LTKQELINTFKAFNNLNVLIIGDVMIDSYLWGDVSRISPEAPVPIVVVNKRENRLGGAANVILNIQSLGANPIICSVIGNDSKGNCFIDLLEQQGITSEAIVKSDQRITTTKYRIVGNNMQMLRVDEEMEHEINEKETKQLIKNIENQVNSKQIDAIIFEDYDKGVISPLLIANVVKIANKYHIPIAVDPKKKNFLHYKGVTLFKPNLKELKEGAQVEAAGSDTDTIHKGIEKLHELMPFNNAMVTLSEHGVYITNRTEKYHISAHKREITDVSGAGDTVISIAALCVAGKLTLEQIANISNLGGGLVCESLGVVPIDRKKLFEETEKIYKQL